MRTFLKSVAGIVVVAIIAACIVFFIIWARVPDMLADTLSKKTKVAVQIDEMKLSWGEIDILKLQMGNPKGSLLSKAFSAETIAIQATIPTYFQNDVVIDEIVIDQIYLGLEFNSATSAKGNWTKIMSNVQSSVQEATSESTRTVLIRKLVLTNISVDVVYRQGDQKIKRLRTIPRIELYNISSQGGFPIDQLMNSVLGQMLKSVFIKENLKNMLEDLLQNPTKNPSDVLDTLRGVFGI
jgi:uncharacterized protein involved in outer membrane biogenesis